MLTEILKEILTESGITQAEIAQRMGIAPQQITRWKRGDHIIGFDNLCKVAEACGDKLLIIRARAGIYTTFKIPFEW